jgi:hypothetical protein
VTIFGTRAAGHSNTVVKAWASLFAMVASFSSLRSCFGDVNVLPSISLVLNYVVRWQQRYGLELRARAAGLGWSQSPRRRAMLSNALFGTVHAQIVMAGRARLAREQNVTSGGDGG